MPTPNVILPKPLIMVQPGGSYQDGSIANSPINFGNIVLVYDTCDSYSAGYNVMYVTTGQTIVNYAGVEYAIIEESKILTNEGNSPP